MPIPTSNKRQSVSLEVIRQDISVRKKALSTDEENATVSRRSSGSNANDLPNQGEKPGQGESHDRLGALVGQNRGAKGGRPITGRTPTSDSPYAMNGSPYVTQPFTEELDTDAIGDYLQQRKQQSNLFAHDGTWDIVSIQEFVDEQEKNGHNLGNRVSVIAQTIKEEVPKGANGFFGSQAVIGKSGLGKSAKLIKQKIDEVNGDLDLDTRRINALAEAKVTLSKKKQDKTLFQRDPEEEIKRMMAKRIAEINAAKAAQQVQAQANVSDPDPVLAEQQEESRSPDLRLLQQEQTDSPLSLQRHSEQDGSLSPRSARQNGPLSGHSSRQGDPMSPRQDEREGTNEETNGGLHNERDGQYDYQQREHRYGDQLQLVQNAPPQQFVRNDGAYPEYADHRVEQQDEFSPWEQIQLQEESPPSLKPRVQYGGSQSFVQARNPHSTFDFDDPMDNQPRQMQNHEATEERGAPDRKSFEIKDIQEADCDESERNPKSEAKTNFYKQYASSLRKSISAKSDFESGESQAPVFRGSGMRSSPRRATALLNDSPRARTGHGSSGGCQAMRGLQEGFIKHPTSPLGGAYSRDNSAPPQRNESQKSLTYEEKQAYFRELLHKFTYHHTHKAALARKAGNVVHGLGLEESQKQALASCFATSHAYLLEGTPSDFKFLRGHSGTGGHGSQSALRTASGSKDTERLGSPCRNEPGKSLYTQSIMCKSPTNRFSTFGSPAQNMKSFTAPMQQMKSYGAAMHAAMQNMKTLHQGGSTESDCNAQPPEAKEVRKMLRREIAILEYKANRARKDSDSTLDMLSQHKSMSKRNEDSDPLLGTVMEEEKRMLQKTCKFMEEEVEALWRLIVKEKMRRQKLEKKRLDLPSDHHFNRHMAFAAILQKETEVARKRKLVADKFRQLQKIEIKLKPPKTQSRSPTTREQERAAKPVSPRRDREEQRQDLQEHRGLTSKEPHQSRSKDRSTSRHSSKEQLSPKERLSSKERSPSKEARECLAEGVTNFHTRLRDYEMPSPKTEYRPLIQPDLSKRKGAKIITEVHDPHLDAELPPTLQKLVSPTEQPNKFTPNRRAVGSAGVNGTSSSKKDRSSRRRTSEDHHRERRRKHLSCYAKKARGDPDASSLGLSSLTGTLENTFDRSLDNTRNTGIHARASATAKTNMQKLRGAGRNPSGPKKKLVQIDLQTPRRLPERHTYHSDSPITRQMTSILDANSRRR